jgi:hypothetical protein
VLVGASALAEWPVRGSTPTQAASSRRRRWVSRSPPAANPAAAHMQPSSDGARVELHRTSARKTILNDYWGISPRSPALSLADLPANEKERHEA